MATLLVMGSRAANNRGNDVDLDVELPPRVQPAQAQNGAKISTKVAIVQLGGMNLPLTVENDNNLAMDGCAKVGDVAVCRLRSIDSVLSAIDAESFCVIEQPRSAHTISTAAEGVYQLSTDAAVAPSAPELPKPEFCSGPAADIMSHCLATGKRCVLVTALTGAAGAAGVTRNMLRNMTSAALQAAALLLQGSTASPVPGLRSISDVEGQQALQAQSQVTQALDAQIKAIRASPLAHTAARMFA